jgi:hypothetical protein
LSENNKLGNMVTTKDDKKSKQAGKPRFSCRTKV